MDIEEKLTEIDKKLDIVIERQQVDKASVERVKQVVFGDRGDNGLRLRVRLLEEDNRRAKWALRVAVGALLAAAASLLVGCDSDRLDLAAQGRVACPLPAQEGCGSAEGPARPFGHFRSQSPTSEFYEPLYRSRGFPKVEDLETVLPMPWASQGDSTFTKKVESDST